MTITVGIIGSGMIGGTVARLSVAAGHHVVLSNSRGPETLKDLVAEMGPLATAATAQQAATAGDIVVVSVPVKAYPHLPAEALAGKVILDTGNYYPQRDGQIADLDNGSLTCSGLLQRQLPDSTVVKVFNNIFFKHLASLARPSGAADRTALPIAGDEEKATPWIPVRSRKAGGRTQARPATAPPTGRSPTRPEPRPASAPSAPRSPTPSGNQTTASDGRQPDGRRRRPVTRRPPAKAVPARA
jgi:predicted dinucleotide-binding enzyme